MKFGSSNLIKWIPYIGVLYAFYESYGQRGIQGLIADIKALMHFSFAGLKDKIMQIVIAVIIYFVGDWLAKEVSNKWIKAGIRTAVYYIVTKTALDVIKSGAGYGGSPGGNFPTGSGNSYNQYEAGAGGA